MKILLALTAAIFAASLPASAYGLYGDEWLGIEGLRIADVHHTEGYIRGIMNLSGERWTPTLGTGTSDVAGVWSFTLTGEVSQRLDLTLYQAEGEVFGEGTLAADGAAWQVAVAGERAYNQLDLRCVVLGSPSLIRLWLGLSTSPARGTYAIYTPAGPAGTGVAYGSKAAPLGGSPSSLPSGGVLPPYPSGSPASGLGAI